MSRRRPRRPLSIEHRRRISEAVRMAYAGKVSYDPPGGKLWSSEKQREYLEKAFQAIEKMIQLSKPDWSKYPSIAPAFVQVTGSVGAMSIMCPRSRTRFIEATLEAIEFEVKHRHLPYDIEMLQRRFKEIAETPPCDRKGADCIIDAIPLFRIESSFLREIARRERCSDVDGVIYFSGSEEDLASFHRTWHLEDLGTKYNQAIAEILLPLTPEIKIEPALGYDYDSLLGPKRRVTKELKLIM